MWHVRLRGGAVDEEDEEIKRCQKTLTSIIVDIRHSNSTRQRHAHQSRDTQPSRDPDAAADSETASTTSAAVQAPQGIGRNVRCRPVNIANQLPVRESFAVYIYLRLLTGVGYM